MESFVSLKLFTELLRSRIPVIEGYKAETFINVLNEILKYPELKGDMNVNEMERYSHVLEAVSTILYPMVEDEDENYWALGNALTPEVFYGTTVFYRLFSPTAEVYRLQGVSGLKALRVGVRINNV